MAKVDKKSKSFTMTDNQGILYHEGRLLKLDHYHGLRSIYVEVDPTEYDARIDTLAKKIASCPSVDLLSILKDALYDAPLKVIDRIEKALQEEITKAEQHKEKPKIKTETKDRGTCVDLVIGKRILNLRQ